MNNTELAQLKKDDPIHYAEVCEENKDYAEAVWGYSQSIYAGPLLNAAELAFKIKDYNKTKELIKKSREASKRSMDVMLEISGTLPGLGELGFGTNEARHIKLNKDINSLEEKLNNIPNNN
ncbi:hypothetical protein HOE04_03980 [archaeon]|mgnify:CR=1 FL=1|jgi:hypothetical protein|nr:hypothetical protein [archaeon]